MVLWNGLYKYLGRELHVIGPVCFLLHYIHYVHHYQEFSAVELTIGKLYTLHQAVAVKKCLQCAMDSGQALLVA